MVTDEWKDTEYLEYEKDGKDNNGNDVYRTEKVWYNANGDPRDNNYYFTQTQRMDSEPLLLNDYNEKIDANILSWS